MMATFHRFLVKGQLSCDSGYTRTGDPTVTCQSNNFYSEPQLSCEPLSCGDLSSVDGFASNVVTWIFKWENSWGSLVRNRKGTTVFGAIGVSKIPENHIFGSEGLRFFSGVR